MIDTKYPSRVMHTPLMTKRRHASLVKLARKPVARGSMMAYLQDKARVELIAFEMGGARFEQPRGVVPPRVRGGR